MEAYNPKKSGRYKEKAFEEYCDKLDEIMKKDPDIGLEIMAGKRVKILEDSSGEIDLPDYPGGDDY